MRCLGRFSLLAVVLLILCPDLGFADEKPGQPLNFVVFLIDDLGWTDLGCQGSDLYETPNIDRLAKSGMRFTQGYSACTVCSPSRAALLTGKYPARLHLTDWIAGHKRPMAKLLPPEWTMYLKREEVTLAEALKEAGYATCAIGKWHLGNEQEGYPDKHGFDRNLGGTQRGQPPSYFSPYKIETLADGPKGEYLTDREAEEACKFIDGHRDKPFFLYVPHHGVHTPLQAKPELVEKFRKKVKPGMKHTNPTYAAMIASVDDSVGRVMGQLEKSGIAERTVVVFTSDNGGLIGGGMNRITSNPPLRAGKGSAYEGGVRVPWIIRVPGITKVGSECAEPIVTPDLYPTLLELAGMKGDAKHNEKVDGKSLVPLLKDASGNLKRDALYWHYPHYHPGGATPYGAIRAGDWRLVEFYEDDKVELFNLTDDVGEKNDLAQKLPEKAKELRQKLHDWRKAVDAQPPRPNPAYKPDSK